MGLAAPLWLQTPDGFQISGRCPIVKLKLAGPPSRVPESPRHERDPSCASHRGTMALRRQLWQKPPRLCTLSALGAPRQDAPFRRNAVSSSSATPGRRRLASQAASQAAVQHPQFAEFLPPRDRTELDDVLSAVQTKDTSQILEAFLAWADVLADTSSPLNDAAVRQAQDLPGPTFSEILRSLDPVASQAHDVAHGLNVTQGQTHFTDVGDLVDEFGVRTRHRRLLPALQVLMALRAASRNGLTPSDYEVCLRCAGAAVDYQAAKAIWTSMAGHGAQESRTSKTWNEFVKARFITEALYYQFDRSRVANLARDMYSNRTPLPMATLKRLDGMRLSINALKREPWNRRPDEPDEDLRRLFRRRADFRGYKGHWIRALYYGHEMDEALLCTSMIAFARSSSLHSIKTMIFKNYYGIDIEEAADQPARVHVSGGVNLPPDSPIRPTARLLDAIVEAFGSMSHIPLGMKLVDFVSRRYDVPIPAETWSNILSWTYLCASKPFKPMRRLHGDWQATATTAADVRQVWDVMTSEPYNVQPSFDDYDVYIKTLITQRSFGRALDIIRQQIQPYYNSLVEEYEKALLDEILQNDIPLPLPSSSSASTSSSPLTSPAHRRRLQAQLRKDDAHHRISTWFDRLLKTASSNRGHRAGPVARVLIPDLLAEFPDFFHHQLRYRTDQGLVQLARPEATRRFEWSRGWRTTLPQKRAGIHVRDVEGADQPDFPWPQVPTMRVLEWRRWPKTRLGKLGRAPADEDKREWWDRLEEELMR